MLAGIAGASAQGVQTAPLFQIGGVDVRPHATYSAVYDDNIFLEHKDKVLLSVQFRGRELQHIEEGKKVLDQMLEKLADVAKVERGASMEGKRMSAMLAPK